MIGLINATRGIGHLDITESSSLGRLCKGFNRLIDNINYSNNGIYTMLGALAVESPELYRKWYQRNSEIPYCITINLSSNENMNRHKIVEINGENYIQIYVNSYLCEAPHIGASNIEPMVFVGGRLLDADNMIIVDANAVEFKINIKENQLPADEDINILLLKKFVSEISRPYVTLINGGKAGDIIELENVNSQYNAFALNYLVGFVKYPGFKHEVLISKSEYEIIRDDSFNFSRIKLLDDFPPNCTFYLGNLCEYFSYSGELDENNFSVDLVNVNGLIVSTVNPNDFYVFLDGRLAKAGTEYDIAYSQDFNIPPKLVFKYFTPGVKKKVKIFKSLPCLPKMYLDLDMDKVSNEHGLISNLTVFPEIYPRCITAVCFTSSYFSGFGDIVRPFTDVDKSIIVTSANSRTDLRITARVAITEDIFQLYKHSGAGVNQYEMMMTDYETPLETKTRIAKYAEKMPIIDLGTNNQEIGKNNILQSKLSGVLYSFAEHGQPIDASGNWSKDSTYMQFIRNAGIMGDDASVNANINDGHDSNGVHQIAMSTAESQNVSGPDAIDVDSFLEVED